MKPYFQTIFLMGLISSFTAGQAFAAPNCVAKSGERRAVLLELYTSEGCDSCPPADRRLSQWKDQVGFTARLVPLAFHVDYWDRLGWTDRFAAPQYTQRQYKMSSLARSRTVYTPQFLRNGRDWRSSGSPLEGFDNSVTGVAIALELGTAKREQLTVTGSIMAIRPGIEGWLALYENNLESQVLAGENGGKVLRHDYVVRRLFGPLQPDAKGHISLKQQITLEADWKPADIGVAAFVQDSTTGEILQALQRHACLN